MAHPDDIGHFINGPQLSKEDMRRLILCPWVPDDGYQFPGIYCDNSGNPRKFQLDYIKQYPWLSYSALPGKEGAFCRYCVLAGKKTGGRGDKDLKGFVTEPFISYRKAGERFKKHQNNVYHLNAISQGKALVANSVSVDERLSSQRKQERERQRQSEIDYRRRLEPVIDTVLVLGVQEMAFRGHRDSGDLDLNSNPESEKDSNLRALLRYRALGDKQLHEDINNVPGNCELRSPSIQNEIIQVCGDIIKESILTDIKKAGIYSIIADSTADASTMEQLVIAMRYVTEDGTMREELVGFLNPSVTTGAALAADITRCMGRLGLSVANLRGQAYDGCGNMSGHIKGVQAIIKESNPLALYTHCASHKLNLALGRALSVPCIRKMLATLAEVSDFVSGSTHRKVMLEDKVEDCFNGERKKKVKPLCRTRWVECHDSVSNFCSLMVPIVMTLQEIIDVGNVAASAKAAALQAVITVSIHFSP